MKPRNWDKLGNKVKDEYATQLFQSMRGQYILGQALYVAIENMKKVPAPHTEVSNIQDMEILMERHFPIYAISQLGGT
jgi:hypothetical protein